MNTRLLLHLTAPVIATSMLLLALGVGAAWYIHDLQQRVSEKLLENVSGMRAGAELEIHVREIRTQLDYFLRTKGNKKYLKAVESLQKDVEGRLREAERWSFTPREQELTGKARKGYDRLAAGIASLSGKPWDSSLSDTVRGMIDDVLIKEIQQPAHDFLYENEGEADQSVKDSERFADRLAYGLLLLGVCGSGAGLLAGFGIARGISRRLVQLSVPIRNAAGRLDEVVGPITFDASADLEQIETVLHQIAERIGAIIDRLRQSERQVAQAEQLAWVGQMAAGMAHELRNPLTSMKILVQAAMEEGGAGAGLAGRDLIVLEDEITRLERLVQSFLEFARPPQIEKRTLEVRPLVEKTIALFADQAALKDTRIELVVSEASNVAVPALAGSDENGQKAELKQEPIVAALDPGQIRQVLLNLLTNALEAGGPAGGVIDVRLESCSDGWLTICVADRGCGLPADLGARIFAPFVTTKEAGLGLGLSICKRIAEAHNGTIASTDRPGGGAEFSLRLPMGSNKQLATSEKPL
jgi:two-component system, NtrC family, sensor histidine kinase HydH